MIPIDEKALDLYLQRWVKQYDRLLLNRFFQGTITAVQRSSTGAGSALSTTGYLVSIRPDKTPIFPVIGDYVPIVGDVVDCIWRDVDVAYVLGPLTPQRSKLRIRAHNNAAQALGNGAFTRLTMQVVDADPGGHWVPATNSFLVKVPGVYHCTGWASDTNAVTARRILVAIFRNGLEVQRAGVSIPTLAAAGTLNLVVSDDVACNAGDLLEVWGWTSPAQSFNGTPNGDGCSFAIHFVGGL